MRAGRPARTPTPARAISWRLTLVVNEGTPGEQRFFHEGTLSAASASNDGPGTKGPDWATARVLTLQGAQAE